MSIKYQKEKIMSGMSPRESRDKINEIFTLNNPGVNIDERYPDIFVWMETWHRLRSHNETLDAVCTAFAAKVKKLNVDKHVLEQKIKNQKSEIGKMAKELATLKQKDAGL